jgi:DNA-binding PadR family transcriptional regulator
MSLQFGILGLLDYSPMTGYKLKKVFDKSINNIWTASLSQIYRELGALEKKGFVNSKIEEQDDRPDKKIYSITEKGKQAFTGWLNDAPNEFISHKRDEFMLKLLFSARLGKKHVKKQLEHFVEDRVGFINNIKADSDKMSQKPQLNGKEISEKESLYISFVVKRAIMTSEILIQWANECIEKLDKLKE